jgi:hypothetical protein
MQTSSSQSCDIIGQLFALTDKIQGEFAVFELSSGLETSSMHFISWSWTRMLWQKIFVAGWSILEGVCEPRSTPSSVKIDVWTEDRFFFMCHYDKTIPFQDQRLVKSRVWTLNHGNLATEERLWFRGKTTMSQLFSKQVSLAFPSFRDISNTPGTYNV